MLVIGFTRPDKPSNILVVGGLLQDIEVTGSGHLSEVSYIPGGSGHNVASILSTLGHSVYFVSVAPFNLVKHLKHFSYSLIPISRCSREGRMLYREDLSVIGVQRPYHKGLSERMCSVLARSVFDLLYVTLELDNSLLELAARIDRSIGVIDIKPSFRINEVIHYLGSYDAIIANQEEQRQLGEFDSQKLVRMRAENGVVFRGKEYAFERSGRNKLGCGDILGAFMSNELLNDKDLTEAVVTATSIASDYARKSHTLEEYIASLPRRTS
ncbi:MAG: PfkB domain protein [Thermotogales bacterium 46_20]|nr:MAG: PfkB domain protein [Thermotogales bacterium 46_20]